MTLQNVSRAPAASDSDSPELELVGAPEAVSPGVVVFTSGPQRGRSFVLGPGATRVGGPQAEIPLRGVHEAALSIVVSCGRAMVCPAAGASVFLGAEALRQPTPIYAGEEVRVGRHVLVVRTPPVVVEALGGSAVPAFGGMVGDSPAMRALFATLAGFAASAHPVLLLGESGTGKELAARALHDLGPRSAGPFVAINCASLDKALFEAHLLGYERGAFTGADRRTEGLLHEAHGGTLFLDEVRELEPRAQAKLLRVLETYRFQRVGGRVEEAVDVRVVAATHRDLCAPAFRQDLRYRLDVLRARMPPLRERRGDIAALARHLLAAMGEPVGLSAGAVARLEAHDWPGNVRELRNVLVRASVRAAPRQWLTGDDIAVDGEAARVPWALRLRALEAEERRVLVRAVAEAGGNRSEAARVLGLARSTLRSKLQKHGVRLARSAHCTPPSGAEESGP